MGQTAKGGGFRLRVMTAKTFGFVTYGQGTVTLTDLGQRLNDPQQEKAAKADAIPQGSPLQQNLRAIQEWHPATRRRA